MLRLPTDKHIRARILNAAQWTVDNNAMAKYSEGTDRFSSLNREYNLPFIADCSAGVTDLFKWAGAPDPNKRNYDGQGYTGTLIAAGKKLRPRSVRSCDVAIFGPGTGWHAALVLTGGANPTLWSMGEQGDPRIYTAVVVMKAVAYVHNADSCEVQYYRYATNAV